MHAWIGLSVGLPIVASLPYWLPTTILALRARIFTRINGEEGIAIPGKLVDAAHFKQVYSHPAANGRSRGAALSDSVLVLAVSWAGDASGAHRKRSKVRRSRTHNAPYPGHIEESGGGTNHPLCVSGAKQSGYEARRSWSGCVISLCRRGLSSTTN